LQVRRWDRRHARSARNPEAAEATRPFAINGARLADRYPDDLAATPRVAPKRSAVDRGARRHEQDGSFVCELAMSRMNDRSSTP